MVSVRPCQILLTSPRHDVAAEEYKKINARFTDENLSMLESKFKAMKNKNQQAVDSISAKQDANVKRKYLYSMMLPGKFFIIDPFTC